jgi:protein subunit release factor A
MELLFSVTKNDFEIQTFSVGGAGGGGKDTSNSGVRLIHKASGARGEGREHRSNTKNREAAFKRLVASKEFQDWHKIECAKRMIGMPVELTRVTPEKGEKIRTYNYKRGMALDHRTGVELPLEQVMDGRIEPFIKAMLEKK